jgi:hypothetical protein
MTTELAARKSIRSADKPVRPVSGVRAGEPITLIPAAGNTGLVPHPASVPAQHRVLVPEHQQFGTVRPGRLESSGYQDWLSSGWRAFRVVTILRLRKDSSHSCPLSRRVVLPDLTSPAAATAIATLAAVISSGAS